MIRVFLIASVTMLLLACSDRSNKVDVDFNDVDPPSAQEEEAFRRQRIAVAKRFNAEARVTNARMRAAFIRGQEACANLRRSGDAQAKGCPRPTPHYVELWDETGDYPADRQNR